MPKATADPRLGAHAAFEVESERLVVVVAIDALAFLAIGDDVCTTLSLSELELPSRHEITRRTKVSTISSEMAIASLAPITAGNLAREIRYGQSDPLT